MTCGHVRRQLSALRDGDLEAGRETAVRAHLESCGACAARWRSLGDALDALAACPRVEPAESVAARVLNRLEVEGRGPGLSLLFRSVWAARPLIWPSLFPAAAVVIAVIAAAVALDSGPEVLPEVYVRPGSSFFGAPALGTEQNPFLAGAGVPAPRGRLSLPAEVLAQLADGTFFLETVVARDGSVAGVRLIEGNAEEAKPLVAALRRQRYEPARYQGRPVAVSVYRLISRMDVRPVI